MLFVRRSSSTPAPARTSHRVLARGEKIILREFERPDVDRWLAWPRHLDPLFESYNPPVLTERQREIYYQQHRESPSGRQFSIDDFRGEYVGRISIRDADWRLGASVLGISFHPGKLGQGLGTDALNTFLGHYFGPMRMSALFLDVAAFNRRAYRVYEKCGFRRCGQRWGEPQTDLAGVYRKREYESLRPLFKWEYGLIRPLLIDMVLRKDEWERLRSGAPGS